MKKNLFFVLFTTLAFGASKSEPTPAANSPASPHIEIQPRMLTWKVGDPTTEKVADITVAADGVALKEAVAMGKGMSAKLETIDATHYRVHVTPKSTTKHESPVAIVIKGAGDPKKEPRIVVYAQIAGASEPPGKSNHH